MTILQTDRLTIDALSIEDAPFILELLNTRGWLDYIGDRGVKTLDDARQYLRTGPLASYERFGFGLYRVRLTDGDRPIGMCGLLKRDTLPDVDMGFAFLDNYIGQGYAHEAASAILTYARSTLGLGRIVAITMPANQPSRHLLERLGFRFEQLITLAGSTEELMLFAHTPDEAAPLLPNP